MQREIFARNYLKNLRLTDIPSFLKHPVHDRDRTRLCVFRMQVYIRVGGLPISPVCSWSKAESRFCSPCHSVSTLVKGLLGESNTLLFDSLGLFDSPLCCVYPQEGNSWRCFVASKSFVHELRLLFFSRRNETQLRPLFFSLSLSLFFFFWFGPDVIIPRTRGSTIIALLVSERLLFFSFLFFLHFRVLELNKYLRVFSV